MHDSQVFRTKLMIYDASEKFSKMFVFLCSVSQKNCFDTISPRKPMFFTLLTATNDVFRAGCVGQKLRERS